MAEYPGSVRFCGACGTHLETGIKPGAPGDPLIGSLVGNRFVVIEKIAQGGMGVVYRAEQTGIWRPVALKVLRPRYSRDKNLHERFRIEAATASRLSHPNTITIYDFGFTDDRGLYIAMEMLDGLSLDQEIARNGALDWRRGCRVGVQICASLQEAHESNILHRDLKPENIMLTNRGNEVDVVKVLDFGIAKIMTQEGDDSQPALTAGNELFGTPEYMSPEQIRGDTLDNRSDIYSLGVILHRMMSGAHPFAAPTPIAVLTKHLTETPSLPAAPEGMRKIPSELVSLIESCLAKQPESRPPSMERVGEILLTVLDETLPIGIFGRRSKQSGSPRSAAPAEPRSRQKEKSPEMTKGDRAKTAGGRRVESPRAEAAAGSEKQARPDASAPSSLEAKSEPEDEDANKRPSLSVEINFDEEFPAASRGSSLRETTLSVLQERMKAQRDFPAMSQSVAELNSKALRNDTSARILSNIILRDYALTSKLLRLVNSPFYSQYRGKVMTISRAVVIMGFEQVRQTAFGLMMFDRIENKNPAQARALKDEAFFSLTSGLVARRIAEHAGDLDPETALVCGIFHRLGKYIVYYYFPKKGKEIRKLIKVGKEEDEAAARKVLGLSFTEIGKWMIREWNLPEQFGEAMNKLSTRSLSKPKDTSDKLRHVVGFAEELVSCAYLGDKDNRSDDLKALARRFEKVAPLAYDQLDELLLHSVNEVRDWAKILSVGLRDSHFIGRMLNWNGLADLPDIPDERFSDAPDAAAGSDEMPTEVADALVEKKSIFEQGIEEITLTMTGRYDLNSLILMALETIYRGLGLSRVVFLLNDVKTDLMVARSGFGEGVEDLIQKLRFQPSRGRDYFNQAAWMGKDIILNDTSPPRVQERLPAWYRRVSDASMMILYPVMLKNFAAGLFYGDILNPNCRINKGLLLYVDRLRNLTARAVREKR